MASLTGGATHNPALVTGLTKPALDPVAVADVTDFMMKKLQFTKSEARAIIRIKANDEAKRARKKAGLGQTE